MFIILNLYFLVFIDCMPKYMVLTIHWNKKNVGIMVKFCPNYNGPF